VSNSDQIAAARRTILRVRTTEQLRRAERGDTSSPFDVFNKGSMVGSKVFITYAEQLASTIEQRFKTFVEDHDPATIAFVRSGHGTLTVIEVATPEQAKKVAAALASSSLSTEALAIVLGDSLEGWRLAQLYTELKQRELEINWINRQW
jgi:hypothetical protein